MLDYEQAKTQGFCVKNQITSDISSIIKYRLNSKQPHLITLMVLSAFASMGAILMMPALPEIAQHFHIRMSTTQLAVTCFLLGYAMGQLIYGPLANRYGRKNAVFVGIIIATIGSIFSILSTPFESFHLLVLGRFLEASGSSAGLAVSIAMINDYYFEKQARRITGLLMLAFSIIPGFAIAIGGALVQFLNWQFCFYFLLAYGLLLIYPTYCLPETNINPDLNALEYHHLFRNYKTQFKIKKLVGFASIFGFSGGCVYVFGAEGPLIGIHLLHISPAIYGLLALMPYIGTFAGSLIAVRLSNMNALLLIKIAFMIEFVASLIMFILFYYHSVSLFTLLIPMGLFCIGHPIIAATALSLSLQQTTDKSNGSAVVNFVSLFMSVVMTFALSIIHTKNALVMPFLFLFALLLMTITFWWTTKRT